MSNFPWLKVLLSSFLAASLAVALSACGEEDATSIRIQVNDDWTGTILASSVIIPAEAGPAESAVSGATWESRGAIAMAKGTFTDISKLKIADMTFEYGGAGVSRVIRVSLPRGPNAQWPKALTIPSGEQRKAVTTALDPKDEASRLGQVMKIELTVPGTVVSASIRSKGRGLSSAQEQTIATLLVPVDVALDPADGQPLVWHVTWERK